MRSLLLCLLAALFAIPAAADRKGDGQTTYTNPIIPRSVPDPSLIRASDGYFYLYGTEDVPGVPIYRSRNLVDWTFIGTAFTDATRPHTVAPYVKHAKIWAPDINYISGQYVLYYSIGIWGKEWDSGIGVASSPTPEGPFTDHGKIVDSRKVGVRNSIDQFYILDHGKNYLTWGSFSGIYIAELTSDGLSLAPGAVPRRISGNQSEATYILKRKGYYYLFGSVGTCCEGVKSTYKVVCGRSKSLMGPYVDKQGRHLLDGNCETILQGNDFVAGPGHNAEFATDDKKQTWMIYHGYLREHPKRGRQVFMSQVKWKGGWPYIDGGAPARTAAAPVFKQKKAEK